MYDNWDSVAEQTMQEVKNKGLSFIVVNIENMNSGFVIASVASSLRSSATKILKCDLEITFAENPQHSGIAARLMVIPMQSNPA